MPGTQEIECAQCKKVFVTPQPSAEVLNGRTASMVVIAHPRTIDCPDCGQAHQVVIEGLGGVRLRWLPIQSEDQPRIVIPNPTLKVPS